MARVKQDLIRPEAFANVFSCKNRHNRLLVFLKCLKPKPLIESSSRCGAEVKRDVSRYGGPDKNRCQLLKF